MHNLGKNNFNLFANSTNTKIVIVFTISLDLVKYLSDTIIQPAEYSLE